jgi:hypothetical protein
VPKGDSAPRESALVSDLAVVPLPNGAERPDLGPAYGIVNIREIGHNEAMAQDHGWFSSTGDIDNSSLANEQRQLVEERVRSRGKLLGVVQVRVFENACEPFVTFSEDAALGVETDQTVIAEMVDRARTRLVDWR